MAINWWTKLLSRENMFCDDFADKVFSWPRTAIEGKRQRFTFSNVAEYKGEKKEVFRYGNQVYSTYTIQCLCNWMSASYSFDMIHFSFRAWNERRLQLGESLRKWCRPVTVTVTVMQMNIWKIVQLSFTELIYRLKDSGKFYVAWHTWETRIHHNHWYFSSLHHPQLMSG